MVEKVNACLSKQNPYIWDALLSGIQVQDLVLGTNVT